MKKRTILMFMLLAVALLAAACTPNKPQTGSTGAIASEAQETAQPQEEQASQGGEYAIGQAALVEGVSITLVGVTQSHGNDLNAPDAGQVYVHLQFDITNNSTRGQIVPVFFITRADGVNAPEDYGAATTAGGNTLGGRLEVGKSIVGFTGVKVPENWQELKISYAPHADERVVFVVKRADLP